MLPGGISRPATAVPERGTIRGSRPGAPYDRRRLSLMTAHCHALENVAYL